VSEQQLDLFAGEFVSAGRPSPQGTGGPAPGEMDDAALIAAIPQSSLADSTALAAEAMRRDLAAAVPALEALCRRFSGFGAERIVPEQAAALAALATIGGRDAAQAVAGMIARGVVQGPGLLAAVMAAARLRATLVADVLQSFLRHAEPGIRAAACGCVCPWPELVPVFVDLLNDLDRHVARSAACALGRMGRIEARPMLTRLLREQPSEDVLDSVAPIADEDGVVLLGRIVRTRPDLAEAALQALEAIDHPRAAVILAAVRQRSPS
jgi:hypothetical protein